MNQKIETNPILDRLPAHLQQYLLPQYYERYTPVNQAVWRYVMRRNSSYLSQVAHDTYLDGLKLTGISMESIPSMYGMNRILKEIGWAAASVDGLIPSDAFMEFQAYNVLVIASEIRQLDHIEYTPAPDIIHESAGHAPIIAIPEYAEYLRRFGQIGCKAISSKKEKQLYEAVRHHSILKETIGTSKEEIESIESQIASLQEQMDEQTEMQQIRNLHWWTVEYGLIGQLENPKIYGAGLLSSIGESKWCLSDEVKKLPYTIEAAEQSFDVTQPQPQLYVTPDFAHLSYVLEEYAGTMSLRKGGTLGMKRLIDSGQLGTVELSTGIQVSGVFTRVIETNGGDVAFIETKGPTALSYREKELIGHGTITHDKGYCSPVGRLKGINLPIENMSPRDLAAYNIFEGQRITLNFEGDIELSGDVVTGKRNVKGKILLIHFQNCMITYREEVLYSPAQGDFYLAIGKKITSAYAGPADLNSFDLIHHKVSDASLSVEKTSFQEKVEYLYQQIRTIREEDSNLDTLSAVLSEVKRHCPEEWLLILEIYELAHQHNGAVAEQAHSMLAAISSQIPEYKDLIEAGIGLLGLYFEKV